MSLTAKENTYPAKKTGRFVTRNTFFLILFFITLPKSVPAQNSTKYADACKQYLNASCPIASDSIRHFVYFARDREFIIDHPFLVHPAFQGAQIMYSWRQLEPEEGRYDFSILQEDYGYLKNHRKKIFVQLQDASFNPKYKVVPDYLTTPGYHGGAIMQVNGQGKPEGWVAKRWDKKVRERFALLLEALGKAFDGKIEGINLQETSIGVNAEIDTSFTEQGYIEGLKENMKALKKAFPKSVTMIYANFTPGEWLPGNDKGYLRSLYQYGEEIGVGLGNPDLMVTRKSQLNHALKFMHEGRYTVPIGIAVQDGNYVGKTGDEKEDAGNQPRQNLVPMLHAFAKDFLRVKYMFWVNQAPYFETDVLPCFSKDYKYLPLR